MVRSTRVYLRLEDQGKGYYRVRSLQFPENEDDVAIVEFINGWKYIFEKSRCHWELVRHNILRVWGYSDDFLLEINWYKKKISTARRVDRVLASIYISQKLIVH